MSAFDLIRRIDGILNLFSHFRFRKHLLALKIERTNWRHDTCSTHRLCWSPPSSP